MAYTLALEFPFFRRNRDRLIFSGLLQAAMLFIGAISLDGGGTARMMLLGAIAYWCMFLMIMVRRNGNATRIDRIFLRLGFLAMLILCGILLSSAEGFR